MYAIFYCNLCCLRVTFVIRRFLTVNADYEWRRPESKTFLFFTLNGYKHSNTN